MFFEIHFLRQGQNLVCSRPRHHDHAIAVGDNDIRGLNVDTIAHHRDIGSGKAVMVH